MGVDNNEGVPDGVKDFKAPDTKEPTVAEGEENNVEDEKAGKVEDAIVKLGRNIENAIKAVEEISKEEVRLDFFKGNTLEHIVRQVKQAIDSVRREFLGYIDTEEGKNKVRLDSFVGIS